MKMGSIDEVVSCFVCMLYIYSIKFAGEDILAICTAVFWGPWTHLARWGATQEGWIGRVLRFLESTRQMWDPIEIRDNGRTTADVGTMTDDAVTTTANSADASPPSYTSTRPAVAETAPAKATKAAKTPARTRTWRETRASKLRAKHTIDKTAKKN